jgi:molybdenum cofactor cytidylyltransferase
MVVVLGCVPFPPARPPAHQLGAITIDGTGSTGEGLGKETMQDGTLVGIVLAAGQSSRMGRPKALLPCLPDHETFVGRVVRVLREGGVARVAVVGRQDDEPLRAHVGTLVPSTDYLENPDPARGQLSSLIVGIEFADAQGARGVVVMPVDIPQVRADSVSSLVAAWRVNPAPILRLEYRGRHGHPVLFRDVVFDQLRAADPAVGAKAVIRSYADRIHDVGVTDPGVIRDVDVPEDYDRLFPESR